MFLLNLLVLSSLALSCFSSLTDDSTNVSDLVTKPNKALGINFALPEEYEVYEYRIELTPYFNTNDDRQFTFDGRSTMQVLPLDTLTSITMHASGLKIDEDQITVTENDSNQRVHIDGVAYPGNDLITLNFAAPVMKEFHYTIEFGKYSGTIRDDMNGFYRSSYIQNGTIKWLGATQFENTGARMVFPCIDEPAYKAFFTLSIVRPLTFSKTLSNMGIEKSTDVKDANGVTIGIREEFYTTPRMSTYLVAFIISEFTAATKTDENAPKQFGIYARPDAFKMGQYPFEVGQKAVAAMDEYTGFEYYKFNDHMKMDHAAIPDFAAGAMENTGLITYKEAILMYDVDESSVRYRQEIASVMAHEIAHMWFGDMVTCHWWSDLWLNEGFATFFQYKIPDMIDNFEMGTQIVLDKVHSAFQDDTSVLSIPLTVEKANSFGGLFSNVAYNKGSSVLRMMEHWIGPETFKKGLNEYLTQRKWQSGKPSDLFSALQKHASNDSSLVPYPNTTVSEVMSSWTSQSGYPLLQVNIDYTSGDMRISQNRMSVFGEEPLTGVLYQIPITFSTENRPDFDNTKPVTVMKEKSITLAKGSKDMEWVIFNKQQIGYYRVNYDIHSWGMLGSALKGDARKVIHPLNRAQVVDDLLNLAKENVTNYETAFDVIQFLEVETDYAPWTAAYAGFNMLRRRFLTVPDTLPKLDNHILTLMGSVTTNLGLVEENNDSHLTKLFRANTLNFACMLGHEGCRENSRTVFENFAFKQVKINPNLREHIYCNGLREGNATHYQFLWNKYLGENVINEKMVILGALGCTKDKDSLIEFLGKAIIDDSPIRSHDFMTAFNSALGGNAENVEIVFNFFKDNLADVIKYYGGNLQSALNGLISRMRGTQLQRVLAFVRGSPELPQDVVNSAISAVANAGVNYEWAMFHKSTVDSWLDAKYDSAGAGVVSSLLLVFSMLAILINNLSTSII